MENPSTTTEIDNGCTAFFIKQIIMPQKNYISTLLLAMLSEESVHPYELINRIDQAGFDDWVSLGRSSVYNALKRLEEEGLVESNEKREGNSPPKNVYKITRKGRLALKENAIDLLEQPASFASEFNIALFALGNIPKKEMISSLDKHRKKTNNLAKEIGEILDERKEDIGLWQMLIYQRLGALYKAHLRWLNEITGLLKRL